MCSRDERAAIAYVRCVRSSEPFIIDPVLLGNDDPATTPKPSLSTRRESCANTNMHSYIHKYIENHVYNRRGMKSDSRHGHKKNLKNKNYFGVHEAKGVATRRGSSVSNEQINLSFLFFSYIIIVTYPTTCRGCRRRER